MTIDFTPFFESGNADVILETFYATSWLVLRHLDCVLPFQESPACHNELLNACTLSIDMHQLLSLLIHHLYYLQTDISGYQQFLLVLITFQELQGHDMMDLRNQYDIQETLVTTDNNESLPQISWDSMISLISIIVSHIDPSINTILNIYEQ